MAETYKWLSTGNIVKRGSDGASIPNDLRNTDWKTYQQWVTDGGVTAAADPAPSAQDVLDDERSGAVAFLLSSASPLAKDLRGVLLLIKDELNLLRQRDRDRSTDVAAATTLADLKTRWAARSALADRTDAQVRTAVQNIINGGTAD